jgi:YVTN family beta-propeller protein
MSYFRLLKNTLKKMKKQITFIALLAFTMIAKAQLATAPITLPNGWKLSPVGKSFALGDLPLNIAVSKSGTWMAVTNNGYSTQTIQLIQTSTEKVVDSIVIGKSFYGLQFSSDEKYLYASGGHDNLIIKYGISNGRLVNKDTFNLGTPWPNAIGPSGICLDEKRNLLYVVTREDKRLYVVDLITKKTVKYFGLNAEAFTCILSPDNKKLYISCWGCDQVNTLDLATQTWDSPITVGDNPNEMLVSPDGKYLYVCNANDNSVSVIDTKTKHVIETLDAALYPNSPSGSTSNSICLDAVHKKLYIANADNNCIAVFDVEHPGQSESKGFIPVGWYPTSVRLFNNKLWVANGKGFTSKPNPYGPSPVRKKEEVISHGASFKPGSQVEYIGGLFRGTMSIIPIPSEKLLATYTKAVYANVPYSISKTLNADTTAPGFPIPMTLKQKSPIKYVFYVIKENRTYDQVLADMPGGNGDTSLLLFGKKITPNQHQIASSFVLLDNFYVNAEVSAVGHNWTMGGYATDYLVKTWPTSYSGRGGTYGGEGEREIANNKNGFLWDQCNRYGVSYRSYGEFVSGNKPSVAILKDHYATKYPSYNLNITDVSRVQVWKKEFDSLVANNKLSQFNTVRLGNDHTEGLKLGRPTPYAHVADNDYAVGLFIEALSKSPIWNETAVFIVEDDAQNGSDHVDAHRSPAYLAGGFVKRNMVDHTAYTTAGILRTIELILGIPPMTQYDAAALPLWRCFDNKALPFNFTAIKPMIDMHELNTARNDWQKRSEQFNFVVEDSNNDFEFNKVLWHGLKGNVPYPAPRRAAFIIPTEKD